MKKTIYLFLILAVGFTSAKAQLAQCNSSLWNHVYNNYRLKIDSACMNVTGTVYSLIYEADGDIHIRLTVDSPFLYMLNSSNYSGELGKLVIEPICATTVTQSDAISSCAGFTNTVFIPNVGEKVIATGPYVTDQDHGWNELHPVTRIALQGAAGIASSNTNAMDGFKVYPVPANDRITFQFANPLQTPTYINIYDTEGRSGGNYQMLETKELNITSTYLPAGIYFYFISQGGSEIGKGQFIISH